MTDNRTAIHYEDESAQADELARLEVQVANLRARNVNGDAAMLIVAELVAIIPVQDRLIASESGATLVAYFKALLQQTESA